MSIISLTLSDMPHDTKTIVAEIRSFLVYCEKQKGLLPRTVASYRQFLGQFSTWLRAAHLPDLSPEMLSTGHVQEFSGWLDGRVSTASRKPVTKKTQNYYLIALRAFLSYFRERRLSTLGPEEVPLIKEEMRSRPGQAFSLTGLQTLTSIPDASTLTGMRDRAILECIMTTGLKVSQVIDLNIDDVTSDPATGSLQLGIRNHIPRGVRRIGVAERASKALREYLKTRGDQYGPLFISYRCCRGTSKRLSVRYVEKMVKKTAKKAGIDGAVTPEVLRNIKVLQLLRQEASIQIVHPIRHGRFTVECYQPRWLPEKDERVAKNESHFEEWNSTERQINDEIVWLRQSLAAMPKSYALHHPLLHCYDCILRRIAILIVSGTIGAAEYRLKGQGTFWGPDSQNIDLQTKKHGKTWHTKMMNKLSAYFARESSKISIEPTLDYGRADLAVYSHTKRVIYVEVGTISLFKLWYNLHTMADSIFLIVPSEEYVVEFVTHQNHA